jgi:hypothetical protein
VDPPGSIAERTSPATWSAFFVWAFFGLVAAFGLLIFGGLGLLPILLGVWFAATRPLLRRSWFGLLSGVGATLLYVAYVQRRGPGTTCWHTARAAGCDEYLNPWPWLLAGAAFVVIGLIAQVGRLRARS